MLLLEEDNIEVDENEWRTEGQLMKDLTKFGEPSFANDRNSLSALVHFMILEHLELIAEDGGMTVLGNVLKDTPVQLQEPCIVALELMKFGMLNGDPFEPAEPDRSFPASVTPFLELIDIAMMFNAGTLFQYQDCLCRITLHKNRLPPLVFHLPQPLSQLVNDLLTNTSEDWDPPKEMTTHSSAHLLQQPFSTDFTELIIID